MKKLILLSTLLTVSGTLLAVPPAFSDMPSQPKQVREHEKNSRANRHPEMRRDHKKREEMRLQEKRRRAEQKRRHARAAKKPAPRPHHELREQPREFHR